MQNKKRQFQGKIVKWFNLQLGNLIRNPLGEERTYFALTIIVGILSALVAIALHHSTQWISELIGTDHSFSARSFIYGGILVFISATLTFKYFPSTSGSGIPNVRIALAVYHGRITIRSTIAKFVTSVLALSSGLSLGREGPTVAICSGIGSFLGEVFHLSKKRVKALVAVGSTGGIAAAFHTPISAVVFTLEEVVGDLNAKMLGSVIIAAVTASITASLLTGEQFTFTKLNYALSDPTELFFYITVGLAAALLGPIWVKLVLGLRRKNLKLFKGHKRIIVLCAFFVVGSLSIINSKVLGSGHETAEHALLSMISDVETLGLLLILKFFATAICFSSGISGGLFMPTLLIGAILGSLVGSLHLTLFPSLSPQMGAYALIGMGAYFAAVIRAPITSILMVFELTRNYNIVLPVMLTNVLAYFLASRIHKGSIYENICIQDGIRLPSHEDHEVLESLVVEDAMKKDLYFLESKASIKECHEFIKAKPFSGYPVLNKGKLIGIVSTNDIKAEMAKNNQESSIDSIAEKKIISVFPDQSLLVALHRLRKFHISRLPVVSRVDHSNLIGIITAEDIVAKFGYHITDEDDDENIKNPEKQRIIKEFESREN